MLFHRLGHNRWSSNVERFAMIVRAAPRLINSHSGRPRAGFGPFRRKRSHSNGISATVIVRKVEQDSY